MGREAAFLSRRTAFYLLGRPRGDLLERWRSDRRVRSGGPRCRLGGDREPVRGRLAPPGTVKRDEPSGSGELAHGSGCGGAAEASPLTQTCRGEPGAVAVAGVVAVSECDKPEDGRQARRGPHGFCPNVAVPATSGRHDGEGNLEILSTATAPPSRSDGRPRPHALVMTRRLPLRANIAERWARSLLARGVMLASTGYRPTDRVRRALRLRSSWSASQAGARRCARSFAAIQSTTFERR